MVDVSLTWREGPDAEAPARGIRYAVVMGLSISACPRCGYDLRGLVASWVETCPLSMMCSECGLEFACAEVLSPKRAPPAWFFEYGPRASVLRLGRTWLRALRAIRFWGSVRLEHPLRPARLLAASLLPPIVLHLLLSLTLVVIVYRSHHENLMFAWTFGVAAAEPTVFDVIGAAQEDLAAALVWPYGMDLDRRWWFRANPHTVGGIALGLVAIFAVAVPLAFLSLGETLRRCRVRPLHLLRGFAWSLPFPVGVAIVTAGLMVLLREMWVRPAGAAVSLVWLSIYWTMFTMRYLRLPHAWGVTAAMLIIGALAAAVSQAVLFIVRAGV